MATVEVRYEQAVYGSFPFRDRGYAMLAQSPGCRPEWLAGFRAACQRYGERPAGIAESGGLFALRLPRGPWMIVGVSPQGLDDRGRPGALGFHGLFLATRDYRRAGAVPFRLAAALRSDWTDQCRELAPGTWPIEPPGPVQVPGGGRVARIVRALTAGRRVALQADEPIDALAEEVWNALSPAVRLRASVATWAFGNGNRFDLVAFPRLPGVALDPSYIDPAALDTEEAPGTESTGAGRHRVRIWPALGAATFLAGAALGLALHRGGGEAAAPPPPPASSPPDLAQFQNGPSDLDERRRVVEGLTDLAERFPVAETGAAPLPGVPGPLMVLIAGRLEYQGALLSRDELALLRQAQGPRADADLALAWDARVRRFAHDRRLPDGFLRGPLRWQLATLAWSFHLDDEVRGRSAPELPHALAEALAVDLPLRPTPLAQRFPALTAYREFLGRLPRR